MSNILNNNLHNLKLNINNDEFWDVFINKDNMARYSFGDGSSMYDKCLISYIDASLDECIKDDWLYSVRDYSWVYKNVVDHTLYNIGYTGMDNGLIKFRRDTSDNKTFYKLYTESTLDIRRGYDDVLKLHPVSGSTRLYDYPISFEDKKIKLNGGFFQGFFKTECDKFQILPSELQQGDVWHFEFVLNKTEFEKESNKTLNDKYPDNKGIFFYLGTRAENKWIYLYDESDDDKIMLSPDDYVEGVEVSKKDYKITNFLKPNPDFVDWEEFFIDDYSSGKHYNQKEYDNNDYFLDDFLEYDYKPSVIDEKNLPHFRIGWGKDGRYGYIKTVKCCDEHDMILNESDVVHDPNFLQRSTLFDDYVDDSDVELGIDYIEEDLDISDFAYETHDGIKMDLRQSKIESDNKFLLFDRTCNGFTVNNWIEGSIARYIVNDNTFNENLFLLMNRTCSGHTIDSITELRNSKKYQREYNIYKDIYNNALAFRIKDDGSIGYRYYILDCDEETNTKIIEGYSKNGIIKEGKWHVINVMVEAFYSTMKLKFYVDGNLIFVTDEMPKLELRKLGEEYEKQETVPYNISLGGGTQGLIETVLPNYMLDPYRVYPLEKNFAGSFIGYMKSFKFYDCNVEFGNINNNFKYEIGNLKSV